MTVTAGNELSLPIPPSEPDLKELHNWAKSMYNVLKNLHVGGLQATFFTQDELTSMTDLAQSGKLFFNSTTNKLQKSNIVGGVLTITDV